MSMKQAIFAVFFLVVVIGCKSVHKNRSDGYFPAGGNCITPSDPACTGSATVGVAAPIPTSKADLNAIFGKCEIEVEGETTPRPCTGLKIVVRGGTENEERVAEIDGFNIKFADLTQGEKYDLTTSSDTLKIIQSDIEPLVPGQPAKIKLKAKPLR